MRRRPIEDKLVAQISDSTKTDSAVMQTKLMGKILIYETNIGTSI
jgi:hypothetical protein